MTKISLNKFNVKNIGINTFVLIHLLDTLDCSFLQFQMFPVKNTFCYIIKLDTNNKLGQT